MSINIDPVEGFSFLRTWTNVIDFDIDFVASNSIVATVNGIALSPVTFTTDQATTIGLLATAISGATNVASAIVTGAREITVIFDPLLSIVTNNTVNSIITTGGVSQPVATNTQTFVSYSISIANNLSFDQGTTFLQQDGYLWIGSSSGPPVPATITPGNGISVTPGANSIAIGWNASNAIDPWTNVDNTMTPYTVLATDYYLSVDCSVTAITLIFPDTLMDQGSWVIKDRTLNCGTNNITLSTTGGFTIDNSATFVMNQNGMSRQLFLKASLTNFEVF